MPIYAVSAEADRRQIRDLFVWLKNCSAAPTNVRRSKLSNIVIVDSDVGFVFWLGEALSSAGHCTLPAQNPEEAANLLASLDVGVDILIADYSIPGASAFAHYLQRSYRHLKIIGVRDESDNGFEALPLVNASRVRPLFPDQASSADWLETVRRLLASDGAAS